MSVTKNTIQHLRLDERSVALFRIILGFSILYNLILIKFPYVTEIWGQHVVIPLDVLKFIEGKGTLSVFDYIRNDAFAYIWIVLTIVLSIFFTAGIYTRLTSILLTFFYFNLLQAFTSYSLGYDRYTFQLLFWSCFLPLNNHFSVLKGKTTFKVSLPISIIILVQISWIYFASGISKYGDSWINGYAVRILASDLWNSRILASVFANHNWLYTPLTYLTLLFEISLPILIFLPFKSNILRYISILFLIGFHASIFLISDVGSFSITGIAAAALLVPSSFWENSMKLNGKVNSDFGVEKSQYKRILIRAMCIIVILTISIKNILFILKTGPIKDEVLVKKIVSSLHSNDKSTLIYHSFLTQEWKMFAPDPVRDVGWLTIEYVGEDNLYYDFFTDDIVMPNEFNIRYKPHGLEFHLLLIARAFHSESKWKSKVFLKYWYLRQLEAKNIAPENYSKFYLAEYRYYIGDEKEKLSQKIERRLYTTSDILSINTRLPSNSGKSN